MRACHNELIYSVCVHLDFHIAVFKCTYVAFNRASEVEDREHGEHELLQFLEPRSWEVRKLTQATRHRIGLSQRRVYMWNAQYCANLIGFSLLLVQVMPWMLKSVCSCCQRCREELGLEP